MNTYTPKCLQEVALRSNAGAMYIENNRLDDAIAVLSGTINHFRLTQHSFPQDLTLAPPRTPIILQQQQEGTRYEDEDGRNGFVYRRPLLTHQDWTPTSITVVSFIITFNLALANHLKSEQIIRTSRLRARSLLQKSKALYELAYSLMMSKPDAGFCVQLSLVISNNLGQVLRAMQDYELANECFSHLLSSLMYLKDSGMDSELNEIDGFLRSTSHLVLEEAAAAAA